MAVLDQRGHLRGRDEQPGEGSCRIEVQRDALTGREGDRARLRHDETRVADFRREQRDIAAETRPDLALVDHRTGTGT